MKNKSDPTESIGNLSGDSDSRSRDEAVKGARRFIESHTKNLNDDLAKNSRVFSDEMKRDLYEKKEELALDLRCQIDTWHAMSLIKAYLDEYDEGTLEQGRAYIIAALAFGAGVSWSEVPFVLKEKAREQNDKIRKLSNTISMMKGKRRKVRDDMQSLSLFIELSGPPPPVGRGGPNPARTAYIRDFCNFVGKHISRDTFNRIEKRYLGAKKPRK